jgi:hypothetical protein
LFVRGLNLALKLSNIHGLFSAKMTNSKTRELLLSTLEYYRAEHSRRDNGYESANEKAKQRLQMLNGSSRVSNENTLKVN